MERNFQHQFCVNVWHGIIHNKLIDLFIF